MQDCDDESQTLLSVFCLWVATCFQKPVDELCWDGLPDGLNLMLVIAHLWLVLEDAEQEFETNKSFGVVFGLEMGSD
jgi:hypothetical protein